MFDLLTTDKNLLPYLSRHKILVEIKGYKMRKNRLKVLFTLIILWGLNSSACSALNRQVLNNASVTQTISIKQHTTELTLEGTQINIPESTTSFGISSSCWPLKSLKSVSKIDGSLVFWEYSRNFKRAFVWDINSFHTKPLKSTTGSPFYTSPDGSFIVDLINSENKLVLISKNQTQSFQLPKGNYSRIQFLKDGGIRIPIMPLDLINNYKKDEGFTDKYYILDPVTGKLTTHSVFLPNFWLLPHNVFSMQYSPDMHYVVYATTPYPNESPKFILLDMNKNKILWSGPEIGANKIGDIGSMPSWKPDGSALIYNWTDNKREHENYYSISLDGKVTELTQFEKTTLLGIGQGWLVLPDWSPNGRYMAFLAKQANIDHDFYFYIWDDQEKNAFRLCLPDQDKLATESYNHVVWSFDSSHLLIKLLYDPDNKTSSEIPTTYSHILEIIIDIPNKTIIELPKEDERGEYTSLYGDGTNWAIGWVNWEIP